MKDRPRILFVNNTSRVTCGTAQSMLFNLKYLRDKYSLGVAAFPDSESLPSVLLRDEIPFHALGCLPFASLRKLVRMIREGDYDLIYANNFSEQGRDAFLAAKLTGRKFIWHIRDPVKGRWFRHLIKHADAVISNSHDTAEQVRLGAGYDGSAVILNGIDPSQFEGDRIAVRKKVLDSLHWSEDTFLILNVGALCTHKNQADAVTVTGLVATRHPNVRLACLGGSEEAGYPEKLWQLIRQNGLLGKVFLLGARPNVSEYLRAADLLLHTDKRFPPFGRGVMEAMAARLPVVAYCVRDVPEVLTGDGMGLLVPPGDITGAAEAICRLIADPELCRSMGSAGHSRVARSFTAEDTARQVDRVIMSVLENRQRA